MGLFCVSPMIVFDDLFTLQHSGDNVQKALANYPANKIVELLIFLADKSRSPEVFVAKMKEADCFRRGFEVDVESSRWSDKTVKDFILFCCTFPLYVS